MWRILTILLYVPKIVGLGIYKCLSYGNTEQLFYLTSMLAVFIINVKCSKSAGAEDGMILVFFIYVMHEFSKLEEENLYLQKYSEFAKVVMGILYRQKKASRKSDRYAKDMARQLKKLGNGQKGRPEPEQIFIIQEPKKKELPKKEKQHNIPKSKSHPIIELGEDEYKTVEENKFGGYLEGGILDDNCRL